MLQGLHGGQTVLLQWSNNGRFPSYENRWTVVNYTAVEMMYSDQKL